MKTSFLMGLLLLSTASIFTIHDALAVASFARQTGISCSGCHTQSFGPNLTPMGRDFKLNGYTMSTGSDFNSKLPPISAMVVGSFTHLDNKLPEAPAPGYNTNNNGSFDEASLFYAGKVYSKLGAFVQLTYNNIESILELDNTDIRLADRTQLVGQDFVYGLSFNNGPTVQDLWNTTPTWSYPYTSSALTNTPGASTLIEGALAQNSGGATAYMMWNNLLYLEAGAYASFSTQFQRNVGIAESATADKIDGGAPYWRLALQHQIGGHYFQVGTFGLRANIVPGRDHMFGMNEYSDLGVDANYQFLGSGKHIFEYKASYIREDQKLGAGYQFGNNANINNRLFSLHSNASYTYDQTYTVNLGYFRTTGSYDPLLYGGNTANKPNSEGFIAELDYVPFGKSNSTLAPWLNLRFALQYAAYTKFDGAEYNYDGSGRNASSNNTLFLNGWLMF
ncbi:cytochrome C [Methylomicrobium sp. Wu6]|uniref:cytochrome C n=1 Tax=Methylomicrobium sp. Wu6 TaxID=3107928 RepID=UPI002DD6B40F|nr:cytochrome C [Methylomicrobium sp. Wu6]MEC4748884.1 cytochrome C [Methylomicrobium sp. Wu6]